MIKLHCNILIAEDNPDHAELIRDTIADCEPDIQICIKRNGEDALRFLYDQHKQRGYLPDLVLMDIKMPRMNGIETLVAIKQDPDLRHIPVIMLSTSTNEAEMRVCIKSGAGAYLSKPLETIEFDEKIRPWLEEPHDRDSVSPT
jgi:two-component system response regulator